jgi:hypothetical protein
MSLRRMMLATLGAYIQGLIDAFKTRVLAFPGIFEAESCLKTQLDDVNNINLLQDATIVITPNGVNENILHTVKGNIITPSPYNLSQYTETTTLWQGAQTVLGINTTQLNPFGVMSSVRLQEAANTNTHSASNNISATIVSGRTYTFSVYFKKGTGAGAPDIIQLTAVAGIGTNYTNFNINTGAVTLTSGCTATITSAPNGWWRCSITATATSTSISSGLRINFCNNNPLSIFSPSYLGAVNRDIFFIGTQIEESPVMTTYQPVLFTQILEQGYAQHVISTTAYRVESTGLVREVPQANLIPFSESFNNWSNVSCLIAINDTTAPDGTNTADKITRNAVTSRLQISSVPYYTLVPLLGTPIVFSIYAKADNGSLFSMGTNSGFGIGAAFNLSTGVITSTVGGATATISNEGNGWYRCAIYIPSLDQSNIMTGQYSSGLGTSIFLWGAQVTRGTTLQPFYPTFTRANTPRIDYTDGSCPTFLLEGTVANRLLRSQEFENVSWVKFNLTATLNTEVAPNDLLEADTLTATANDGYTVTNTAGAFSRSIFSVYLKRKTGTGNVILETGNQSSIVSINSSTWTRCFLLNTNNNGTYSATSGTYTITTILPHNLITGEQVSLDVVGGGGVDHTAVVTVTGVNTFTTTFGSATGSGNVNVYAAFGRIKLTTSGDEVYAWGAQLESIPGSLQDDYYEPTSYIPTAGSTVSRGSDFLNLFKIRDNNLLNNTFSLFWEVKKIGGGTSAEFHLALTDTINTIGTNSIFIGGVPLLATRRDNNVSTIILANTVYQPDVSSYYKGLITCDNGIIELWIDGSKLSTSTMVNYDKLVALSLTGNANGISRFKQVLGWNRVVNRTEIDLLFQYPYFNAGYTPVNNELQQIINRANAEGFTIPSTTILGHCDTLITNMKNDGVWNVSDVYYNFAYNDVTLADWAKINWMNPSGGLYGLCTVFPGMTYRVDGYKGDGVSGYIDTNFSPSRANYNYTLNDASRFLVISEEHTSTNSPGDGVIGNSNNRIVLGASGAATINAGNIGISINMAGLGLKAIIRYLSNSILGINTSTTVAATTASTVLNGNSQLVLRTGTTYGDACIANYFMGASLTNTQIQNFRTYYNTYLTNIGLTPFA